jgi:general secretion pathway protein C
MFSHGKVNVLNTHMARFYHVIFNIFAITMIVYIGVDAFHRIVRSRFAQVDTKVTQSIATPVQTPVVKSALNDYQAITDRNIFSKINVSPLKNGEVANDLKLTSLKLSLMGTIAGNSKTSAAFIEDAGTKTQGLYKVGDNIQGAVIKSITRNKVTLKIGARDEVLTMGEDASSKGKTTSPLSTSNLGQSQIVAAQAIPAAITDAERNISMNRAEINSSLKDLNELMSQASIQPHSTDGQADGLAVSGIKAGSIFRKMGLRNGDIVKSVNNEAIKTPEDLINMYNDLKSSPDVSVQILRRGQERTLNYNFVD